MSGITLTGQATDVAFEKLNQHRAYAESVIYNRNWLPGWFVCWYLDGFSDHGDRYFRGEAQPPALVRAWWHYRHWRLRRWSNPSDIFDRFRRGLPLRGKNPIIPDNRRTKGGLVMPSIARPGNIIPLAEGEKIEMIDFQTGQRSAMFISNGMSDEFREQCRTRFYNGLPISLMDSAKVIYNLDGYEVDADLLSHQLAAAYYDGAFPHGPFYRHGSDLIGMLKRGGPDFIAARQIIEGLRIRPIPLDFPLYKKTGRWHERLNQEVDRRLGDMDCLERHTIGERHPERIPRAYTVPRMGLTMEQAAQAIRGLQTAMNPLVKVTSSRENLEAEHRREIWESNNCR